MLKGKCALITGSVAGLGYAIAEALAAAGCNIVLNGIVPPESAAAARDSLAQKSSVDVLYEEADIGDAVQIERLIANSAEKFGAIDIEPSPVVVADTVGAGDSFQAAMLAWLSERHRLSPIGLSRLTALELRDLGRFAARAASFTCRYRGPHFPHRNALI